MAEPNMVEKIEVCWVAAAVPDHDHHDLYDLSSTRTSVPKSLPLTFFDLRWSRLGIPMHLYFYEMSAPEDFFHTNIVPRLKHSLSLTLGHHFLPMAGTLTWPLGSPKPVLTYAPGDAVSLTVARSNADFSLLSDTDNVICDATMCHPLVADLPASRERLAVIAIQLTVFPNCGFTIGITLNHVILDAQSFVMFMKSWARICGSLGVGILDGVRDDLQSRICLPADLLPFYDRGLIMDPANLEAVFLNHLLNSDGPQNRSLLPPLERRVPPNLFEGTFQFPREKLEELRRLLKVKIKNERQYEHPVHLSTFSLTCAYAWVCLVKAEGIKDSQVVLSFPVDCRSRLEPPLPQTYFGNCIATGYAVAESELLLGKEGLFVAIKAISDAIKSINDRVLDGAENWISGPPVHNITTSRLGRLYTTASSHHLGYYNTDFGWGQPRKMNVVAKYITGMICFSDRRNGDGGVEIGLVLKKPHMEAFASLFVEGLNLIELALNSMSRIHLRL